MENPAIIKTSPETEIVSSRVFACTADQMFKAWAEAERLKTWWGPAGFTNTFHEFDFQVGGQWRFTMHGPDKGNYENHCEFVQIVPPKLIAWKRHSKPLFQILATFEEQTLGQTLLTFKMLFESAEESEKIRRFAVEKNEENFDKLALVLAQIVSQYS